MLHIADERITRCRVPQKGNDIARRRQTEPGHDRILRRVRELVDRALPERRSGWQQPDRGRRRILPAARIYRRWRVVQARAHGERRLRLVQSRRRIGQPIARGLGVLDYDVFVRGTGYVGAARSNRVFRNGKVDLHRVCAARAKIPSHRNYGVAQVHDETVACVSGRCRIVG